MTLYLMNQNKEFIMTDFLFSISTAFGRFFIAQNEEAQWVQSP